MKVKVRKKKTCSGCEEAGNTEERIFQLNKLDAIFIVCFVLGSICGAIFLMFFGENLIYN